ncbi:MAG: sortase [Anaerolineales bacterium]|nr:sortase [Anaerolineales bacterium]
MKRAFLPRFAPRTNYTGASTPYPTCDIIGGTTDGTTDINFYVSDEIIDRGQSGLLVGGCIPPAGLGTAGTIPPDFALNCDPGNNGYNNGATTGEITFQADVQNAYSDDCPSGDCSMDQGDTIKNEERPTAYVLNNSDLSSTTNSTTDTTSITNVSLTLDRGTSQKDIYAVNGNTTLSSPLHVSAGDVITYKLKYDLTTSNFEDLYFTDYLPLPVLDVDDPKADGSAANWPLKVTTTCAAGASPAAGGICFSSTDTFFAYSSVQPSVSINSTSNTLKIDYGDYDNPANQAKVIELLFSITVNSKPFTDGLKLTNQAAVHEGSTQGNTNTSSAIIDFTLDEPVLVGKKSVITTDNTNATMDPAISGYTFTTPGSSGKRWTSPAIIDSPHLKNNPINSNINGSDGGDLVTFALVIENQSQAVGSGGGAYDITLKDSLPSNLQIPTGGLNLAIYLGDGTGPISYTKPDGTAAVPNDLLSGGIKLDDPASGLCQAHSVGPGKSVIIITYDLQIKPTVSPGAEITNAGTVTNYSNKEAGEDFTGAGGSGQEGDLVEKAKIKISDPVVAKSITSTTLAATGTAEHRATIEDLAIGEEATFEVVVTLPEGNSTSVTITDNLPTSPSGVLSVQSSCVISVGTNLTLTNNPPGTCPTAFGTHNNTDADAYNDQVVFDFGDVTNSVDGVEDDKDKIKLQVVAKVEGDAANQDGDALENTVTAQTGSNTQTGSVEFDIVVPVLDISGNKTDGTDYFATGGLMVYGITYQNTGTGPATGVKITETVPPNTSFDLTNSSSGWVVSGTTTPCADNAAAGTVCDYSIGQLNRGAAAQTIYFAVEVDDPLNAAVTQISNTASISDEFNYSSDSDTDTNDRADIGKSMLATNQAFTVGNEVVIGELVTYRVVVSVPAHDAGGGTYSGLMPNLTVTDDLDEGLAFMDCVSVTSSSVDLTTDLAGGFSDACAPDTVNHQNGNPALYPIPQTGSGSTDDVNQARRIIFDLGDVTNTSSSQQTITLEYRVAVLNNTNNVRGVLLNNRAVANWTNGATSNDLMATATNVEIIEPEFTLSKYADRKYVYGGEVITFYFDVRHTSRSVDAFEVILSDAISPKLKYVAGSLTVSEGLAADVYDDSDPKNLKVTWNSFPQTDYAIVEFQAQLSKRADTAVDNIGYLEWTSLSGDVSSPQSEFNDLSTERWYDPPAGLELYGTWSSMELVILGHTPPMPDTGFPPGRAKNIYSKANQKPHHLADEFRMMISSLNIDLPLVGIPRTENGWNLTWLAEEIGFLDGTAYPTWPGNTVLTGHAYLSNGKPGPFVNLDQLNWGDKIIIKSENADYVYEVRERYYAALDSSDVFQNEQYDWITLITCYHYDEESGKYLWRVVVRAVIVDVVVK